MILASEAATRTFPVLEIFGPTCREWPGARTSAGYGVTWYENHWELAHRAAYAQYVGQLEVGKQVHHRCNNPSCVNPAHLVQLTPAEHAAEHPEKPEIARRNGAKMRKLTMAQAQEIRRRHCAGERQVTLAREFGLSVASMNDLVHGRSYLC